MKVKRINRRQFLVGAGGFTLALPVLTSLLPKALEAGEFPYAESPRFVCLTTQHGGIWNTNMYPQLMNPQQREIYPGHNMRYGPMTLQNAMGEAWLSNTMRASDTVLTEALAQKMTVLQGLDIMFYIAHHSGGYLGNYGRNDGNDSSLPLLDYRPTIDQVMAWSDAFYPDIATIKQRSIHIGGDGGRGISWGYANPSQQSGTIDSIPSEFSSLDLFNRLFDSQMNTANPRTPVIDRVFEHYQSLESGAHGEARRLSYDDRQKLTAHMDRLNELQARLAVAVSCDDVMEPTDEARQGDPGVGYLSRDLPDAMRHYQLYNDVVAAAFMCNLSRVATINVTQQLSTFDGDWHQNISHQSHLAEELIEIHAPDDPETILGTRLEDPQAWMVGSHRFAFENIYLDLVSKLDVEEANGVTFLDNSLLMWTQESGCVTHDSHSMPLVLAGSGAGMLRTGQMIDYRNLDDDRLTDDWLGNLGLPHFDTGLRAYPGIPYNRFLGTVLQVMNIPPSEFEAPGERGYADPFQDDTNAPLYSQQKLDDMSDPLPELLNV